MDQRTLGYVLGFVGVVLVIVLASVKVSMDKQNVFLCEVIEDDPNVTMADCPAHSSSSSWLIMSAFAMAFLVLGSGIYLLVPKKHVKRPSIKGLSADEKKICDLLVEHEGSMYQSDLIKETEFSKVKITRVLDKLEQKNVIDRKRRGMANLIILK